MPTFTTPTTPERLGGDAFFSRIHLDRGVTVLKETGAYREVSDPTPEEVTAADIAYLGGRKYTIDAAEAADLTAAGYGAYIS